MTKLSPPIGRSADMPDNCPVTGSSALELLAVRLCKRERDLSREAVKIFVSVSVWILENDRVVVAGTVAIYRL